jgi:hypothetical protein
VAGHLARGADRVPLDLEHEGGLLPLGEGGGERVGEPLAAVRVHDQPVHHDQELVGRGQIEAGGAHRVRLTLVARPGLRRGAALPRHRQVRQVELLAVGPHPQVALGLEVGDGDPVGDLPGEDEREGHLDAGAGLQGEDRVHGRGDRVGDDPDTALRAPRPARAGPQEAHVVVHLGHRAHRGAAGLHRVALVDGDRGAHPLQPIHRRLLHALQELLGVGGQRLDVAALSLRVDGVEREAGLPRARRAREHGQGPARDLEVDPLEVVLSRPEDADHVGHGCLLRWWEARPGAALPGVTAAAQ